MKKPYSKPEFKTTLFTQQDVICVSGPFRSFRIMDNDGTGSGVIWGDVRDF